MLHGLVGDGELAQVGANHLELDFHPSEGLAVLGTHHAAYHLGQDDPVLAGASSPPIASLWVVLPGWLCAGILANATSAATDGRCVAA